jgi:nucleoid DNA-binding protein
MTKQSLVNEISDSGYYLQKNMLLECVNKIIDTMTDALIRGESIEIRGFGSWTPEISKPRKVATISRDEFGKARLNTGKRMMPARRWVKFKLGKELKLRLAQNPLPGQHGTTTTAPL